MSCSSHEQALTSIVSSPHINMKFFMDSLLDSSKIIVWALFTDICKLAICDGINFPK